jgi:hypothetical protein
LRAWAVVDNPFGDYDATPRSAVDPSGRVYVTGISEAYDGTTYDIDWVTRKYDANGRRGLDRELRGRPELVGRDAPHDMILVNGAGPIITGAVRGDAATLAYGAP